MNEKTPPILELLSGGMRLVVGQPRQDDVVLVGPEESALAASLLKITKKYGKFDHDYDGVWAGYKSASENNKRHIGVKCSNCIMWEGGNNCKIIGLHVEAEGKCRFAIIPNGVVKKFPQDVSLATIKSLEFLESYEIDVQIKAMKYTKPEVRERLKRKIMAGSKGGRPGQWSARKAQLLAQEYRKAGGGYRGKPGKTQRSLKKWTREEWTTSDGKPALRKGRMTRYLPSKAWKKLTPAQRQATIRKKLAGDKKGRQFVGNTRKAEAASRSARD